MRRLRFLSVCLSLSLAAPAAAQTVPSPEVVARTADVPAPREVIDTRLGVEGGLRADDVAERATDTSTDLRAREHDANAAALAVDQALAGFFPRVTLGASYTRLSDITMPALGTLVAAPGATSGAPIEGDQTLVAFAFQFPVLLNQTVLRAQLQIPLTDYFLRVAPGVEAAESSRDAARATARATQRRVEVDARTLYYTWARARLQAAVADQAVETVRDHLAQAEVLVRAGSLPESDATRVEAQVASAELLAARAHNLEDVLADRLHTAMHDDAHGGFEIGEALTPSLPSVPEDISTAVDDAWATRPELDAVRAQIRAADRQVTIASAGFWPQIMGVGEILTANPNQRFIPQADRFDTTWSLGVALTWSPNDLGIAVPTVHAAEERRESASAQLDGMRDAIRTEVLTAWQQVRDASAALATTERGLAAAEATYESRRALFVAGRSTTLELLDAEIDLTRARLEATNARADAAAASARWRFAIGE